MLRELVDKYKAVINIYWSVEHICYCSLLITYIQKPYYKTHKGLFDYKEEVPSILTGIGSSVRIVFILLFSNS